MNVIYVKASITVALAAALITASAAEWTKVVSSQSTDSYIRIQSSKVAGIVEYEVLLDLKGGSLPMRSVLHRFIFLCSPINRVRFLGSTSYAGQLGTGTRIGGMRPEDLGDADRPRELQDHEILVRNYCPTH